jgi:drug/metabolite transporter (DMT)-like permease
VTFLYLGLALVAFASNSLLCRVALGGRHVDAASFTTIRLASGAAMLAAIAIVRGASLDVRPFDVGRQRRTNAIRTNGWRPAFALFAYAIAFSFAYISLPVATGALILFGAVQTTMLGAAIRAGERPRLPEWIGLLVAVGGLIYLVLPGVTAPSAAGAALMAAAGMAWGWYSLLGRRGANPIGDTTTNFIRSVPFTAVVSVLALGMLHLTTRGVLLAAVSGAITSGLGYVAWYAALPRLTATRAAIVQLATPALTAAGGILFLGEAISARLGIAAALILGGIAIAVFSRLQPR